MVQLVAAQRFQVEVDIQVGKRAGINIIVSLSGFVSQSSYN